MALIVTGYRTRNLDLIKQCPPYGHRRSRPYAGGIARTPAPLFGRHGRCTGCTLVLALAIRHAGEIVRSLPGEDRAAKESGTDALSVGDIDESLLSANLCTQTCPDPDLLIRTGGRHAWQATLLYQIALYRTCSDNFTYGLTTRKARLSASHRRRYAAPGSSRCLGMTAGDRWSKPRLRMFAPQNQTIGNP